MESPTVQDMSYLIALDIDGTILRYDGTMSPRVRAAVTGAEAAGHHIVIATGRSIAGTVGVLADLGLSRGYAVCSNGAVTVTLDPSAEAGYRLDDAVEFDPAPVVSLLHQHLPNALFAVELVGRGMKVNRPWPEDEIAGEIEVVGMDSLTEQPVSRVVVHSPDHNAAEFGELVHRIGLHGVSYSVGYTAWLDLAPEGVSKASALERVRRRLGVEPFATIAVGDGSNDLEMIEWAARGIAMDNAIDELKAVADEVGPNVDDDGLAVVLENLVRRAA